jgi:hypothetical protein
MLDVDKGTVLTSLVNLGGACAEYQDTDTKLLPP